MGFASFRPSPEQHARPAPPPVKTVLSPDDDPFLDEIERNTVCYFWEQANPQTGLVRDRCNVRKATDNAVVASIAATGFGLTALCIAEKRGFVSLAEARDRVLKTLRFHWRMLPIHRGFFYHWANVNTGERMWDSEISSVDTAILLCGILTCRQHFDHPGDPPACRADIFNRVDWTWLSEDTSLLPHGWTPEVGFLPYRWDYYSELMMMYLLGLGSSTHPLRAGNVERLEADDLRIRRAALHRLVRAAVRAPVFPGLVRFPRQARPVCRLLPELDHRHRCASPLLHRTGKAIPRLQRRSVGHHRFGFAERLCGLGRSAGDGPDRRDRRSQRGRRLAAVSAAGDDARFADDQESLSEQPGAATDS